MTAKTLFLAWQDNENSKRWFPVGRLDADAENRQYSFRYTGGARCVAGMIGRPPVWDFPELDKAYQSAELFPLFQNRVLNPRRPDFARHLEYMDLPEYANGLDMLSLNLGARVTDAYEVFPKLARGDDGGFVCRFFLHGGKHTSPAAQARVGGLRPGEELRAAVELNNPLGELALQLQSADDYQMLGWAPRYLAPDLAQAEAPGALEARVVRVNPPPVPSEQRALVELRGRWPENYEPMSGEDYQPLAG